MLTTDQKKQFNEIFEELGKSLDITTTQYESAVTSYQFVGDWLSRPESPLAPYNPEILPQGSFILGTMIKPIHTDDDLDVDLVCRLDGKKKSWTQSDLKKIVGDRLKAHDTLRRMLDEEGRRCWTLLHRESSKFHMDVLPAIVASNFKILLEKTMSASDLGNVAELAIRITDNLIHNYFTETDPAYWLKSNPFGYAAWFKMRSFTNQYRTFTLSEAIQPVPAYDTQKVPLQRIVQVLKRHRDILFNGDCDKPISIIITTLAAQAYRGQTNIIDGLISVVNSMENYIEERYDPVSARYIKWIPNPVNPEENFADKWIIEKNKQENFYKWLQHIKADVAKITAERGLHKIKDLMTESFGKDATTKAFSEIGESALRQRESGAMKMAAGTGVLGNVGRIVVPLHNNFGADE